MIARIASEALLVNEIGELLNTKRAYKFEQQMHSLVGFIQYLYSLTSQYNSLVSLTH